GERTISVPVEVLPKWNQTWWFRIAALLAGIAALFGIVRSRTAYLRRRQAELERQIAERTGDLRAANERLFALATTDPLTGSVNRRRFIERADDLIALSTRYGWPLSLVVMDIDHFKRVNDTHGHPAGDEVLRTVAQTCQTLMRATDLLGRMGGEEF